MINEVTISRLDELIGDYDTPFFNYLLYSYGLSLNDCEVIIADLKSDIDSNRVIVDNLVSTLEDYFKRKVIELEKESKLEYLSDLISPEGDYYDRFLKAYDLSPNEIRLIHSKVEAKIMEDNITDFEIKRYLDYYFANAVKQGSYFRDLDRIVGNAYDTLIIEKAKRDYPILVDRDIVNIVLNIRGKIIDAVEFKKGIKHEFFVQCMRKSEAKKAKALSNLEYYVEGSGDSFSHFVKSKGLTRQEGNAIVSQIKEEISRGMIQPEWVDGVFLTKRFNEYNERE
ncbi:MAG: hypothetical protein ILA26_07480 [Methanobrevibacter sp.]|uniref:hypothetical protein n=1 Tax=Methanobrevibacter sp. TaxID=66852 RepID=UPI001B454C4D|nr:hypothetical protein [Methanobrevibacter sp.]MBP3791854.1 hypothetical protein [Methanobrevibacter sp.]